MKLPCDVLREPKALGQTANKQCFCQPHMCVTIPKEYVVMYSNCSERNPQLLVSKIIVFRQLWTILLSCKISDWCGVPPKTQKCGH